MIGLIAASGDRFQLACIGDHGFVAQLFDDLFYPRRLAAGFQRDSRLPLRCQIFSQGRPVELELALVDDFTLGVQLAELEGAVSKVHSDGQLGKLGSGDDILLHGWSPFCTLNGVRLISTSELTAAGWGPARSSYLSPFRELAGGARCRVFRP